MTPRRWTFAHVVALVELACGVVAAVWLFGVGIAAAGTGGRSVLDRSFPFLVGAAVGLGLAVQAVRTWRAAEREAREAAGRQASASSSAAPGSRPSLSAEGQRELDRVVALLAAAGVFAPRAPEPVELSEAVADAGEPVLAEAVLMAVEEAAFYRPDFRASEHSANLAFHDSHTEQFADVLQAQAEDLVRLAGGGLAGVSTAVEIGENIQGPVRLRITVDGDERVLDYAGAAKYLSTVLHVTLAGIARERGSERRLAWLWSDQGVWLSGLRDGDAERLNAALGPAAGEGWEWVDEQPPTAAAAV